MALDQLIAAHDATHREYAQSIARGDSAGAIAANRDLINLGEQLDAAAQQTIAEIDRDFAHAQSVQPELRERMRSLGGEAAELGRLSRETIGNSARSVELAQGAEASRAAISASQAIFLIFLICAVAFVTGYYRTTVAFGVLALMVVYKPFSATVRWQSLV